MFRSVWGFALRCKQFSDPIFHYLCCMTHYLIFDIFLCWVFLSTWTPKACSNESSESFMLQYWWLTPAMPLSTNVDEFGTESYHLIQILFLVSCCGFFGYCLYLWCKRRIRIVSPFQLALTGFFAILKVRKKKSVVGVIVPFTFVAIGTSKGLTTFSGDSKAIIMPWLQMPPFLLRMFKDTSFLQSKCTRCSPTPAIIEDNFIFWKIVCKKYHGCRLGMIFINDTTNSSVVTTTN